MPAVSVIVPAFEAAATLGRTLDALARQDLEQAYEVVVVDDGSRDATAALVDAFLGPVKLVRQSRAGPGPARNRGVREAAAPRLAFTDADCVPHEDWLRRGFEALESADLVQGAVWPDPHERRDPFDRTITVAHPHGLFETASLFVRRELFDRLGGFEDPLGARIGKPLAEDVWFGWRARRNGARISFCAEATVHHDVFRRGPSEYMAERLRRIYFPALAKRIPELREAFLYRRWFLDRRTAAFDAALAGVVAAGIAGAARRPPAASLALVAALPYARMSFHHARPWGRRAPLVATVEGLADLVGFGALVAGSVRWRSPVL
jgi:glycosyltransferase involved in cell wall biosynthesis